MGQSGHTSSVGLLKGCTALALLTRRRGLCNTTHLLNDNVVHPRRLSHAYAQILGDTAVVYSVRVSEEQL